MDKNRIQLLEATLRDGGFCLEDAYKNDIADVGYTERIRKSIIEDFCKTGIEIIELGALEESGKDKRRFEIYDSMEELSKNIPQQHPDNQIYAAMFRGPDIPLEKIPDYREGLCEAARLIVRYSELKKSLDYCRGLAQKGYKVFVQPMLTMRYTEEELNLIIREANDMNAYAVYFVDSYGYMTDEDVYKLTKRFDDSLKPEIRLGFHSHNNMHMAFSNAVTFIKYHTERNIIVDSCLLGMGQGAGNLQTELITYFLNDKYGKSYNYEYILNACEKIEMFLHRNLWGCSIMTLIPSLFHTAYKYGIVMREKYKMSYVDIYRVVQNMPERMRQRYTSEALNELLLKMKET